MPQSFGPLPAFYTLAMNAAHRRTGKTAGRGRAPESTGSKGDDTDAFRMGRRCSRILTLAERRGAGARTADTSIRDQTRVSLAARRARNPPVFGTIGFCLVSNARSSKVHAEEGIPRERARVIRRSFEFGLLELFHYSTFERVRASCSLLRA